MFNKCITLEGTFMNRDVPLAKFEIFESIPQEFTLLCYDIQLFPFEMQKEQSGWTLVSALTARLVPLTRQHLFEDFARIGITISGISDILEFQNASACDDPYWVRFNGEGPQTWKQLLKKIGYTVDDI